MNAQDYRGTGSGGIVQNAKDGPFGMWRIRAEDRGLRDQVGAASLISRQQRHHHQQ